MEVPEDRPPHQGSSITIRKEVIDLSIPRQIANYDKFGCGNMPIGVKIYLFGSKKVRLTKRLCEEFFADDNNFEIDIITRQWLDSIFR
jgi:hypothetical protein